MPQTQKRKCSVSFGELISFLSIFLLSGSSTISEAYSLTVRGATSEEARDAFFEHHHFVLYSRSQGLSLQQLQRFFDGLV